MALTACPDDIMDEDEIEDLMSSVFSVMCDTFPNLKEVLVAFPENTSQAWRYRYWHPFMNGLGTVSWTTQDGSPVRFEGWGTPMQTDRWLRLFLDHRWCTEDTLDAGKRKL
jgi:hypothetical protein